MADAIKSYRDLRVWQEAMDLVVLTYGLAKQLPRDEQYGLISQIRRAAASIPANIAEGHGQDYLGDYLRHLSVAKGSLVELETHLFTAQRLSYLGANEVESALSATERIGRMLSSLTAKLRARSRKIGSDP